MRQASPFQRFARELRRRHVPQTAAVYLVAAWAAIQFADVVGPNLNGIRRVEIVVRTADGREIRRDYPVHQRPGGSG